MNRKPQPLSNIDLNAPDGLDKLFSFHRNIFGDSTMEDDGDKAAADKAAADKAAADKEAADKAAANKSAEDDEDKDLPPDLGDAGKRALKAERKRAKDAIAEAAEAKRLLKEREDADLSESERTKRDLEDQRKDNEKLRKDNLRLAALSKFPVPEKYQYLVSGTDEASFLQSAQDISEMAAGKGGDGTSTPRPGYVPDSGKGGSGGEGGSGGLVAAGRDRYKNSKKK